MPDLKVTATVTFTVYIDDDDWAEADEPTAKTALVDQAAAQGWPHSDAELEVVEDWIEP